MGILSYPDKPGKPGSVHNREGTLDTLRYKHCEAVGAIPVELQIYDSVLNQIERPDRISLQDGIIWRMCKIRFGNPQTDCSEILLGVYAYLLFHQLSKAFTMMSTRCGTGALLFICVFNLLDNAKLPEIMVVALSVCGAYNEVVRSRQQGLVCGTSTRPFHRTCASMNQVQNRVHKREGTLHACR